MGNLHFPRIGQRRLLRLGFADGSLAIDKNEDRKPSLVVGEAALRGLGVPLHKVLQSCYLGLAENGGRDIKVNHAK
jgi:hypothetical protein